MAGNNACIVCDDAELEKVVPQVTTGALFHAGQVCVASKRIYVHESLYDRFLDMLVEESKKFAVDDDESILAAACSLPVLLDVSIPAADDLGRWDISGG